MNNRMNEWMNEWNVYMPLLCTQYGKLGQENVLRIVLINKMTLPAPDTVIEILKGITCILIFDF